jgi:geranylgeranyl pyrophosphate synthase
LKREIEKPGCSQQGIVMEGYVTQSRPRVNQESIKKVLKILKQRAAKSLQTAKESIIEESVHSKEARQALRYYAEKFLEPTAPALISLACEAVGGDAEETTLIGAAIALYVGAVDVHDDIIDRSRRKNGRPTVLGRFGPEVALLTGDALLLKGFELFYGATRHLKPNGADLVADAVKTGFFEMGDAHAMEMSLKKEQRVTVDEYLAVINMKVACWEAFAKIGAIIGNGTEQQADGLSQYGRIWGLLSTIRNDFVDLYEAEELRNRMRNEILPLPILYASEDPEVRKQLSIILLKKRITEKDLKKILDLVLKSKHTDSLRTHMRSLMDEAKSCLGLLRTSEAKSFLTLFISSMLEDLD